MLDKKHLFLCMKDYMGHVFWDQETWMYPPILLLHSKMGEAIVQTRVRTLDAALQTAKMRGYKGAMYPWETALSGINLCAFLCQIIDASCHYRCIML